MKIRRLDLTAYGPFRGRSLALGGRAGVLDLVYGPNEAGKSTTLRAVSGLLFGIPERTDDAHRHAPSELRIGGLLEARAGTAIEIVRRKGRKNTLRAPDDSPLDEAVLAPFLFGTTRELFESLFGLDHERLRASAQALLVGKGNLGESLFAAGVGGRDIHELSLRLEREAEELFAPRARERKLSRAITEVKEARDAVREAATNPSKYLEQQRALEEAKRVRETLRAHRTELVAEQARLGRVVSTLPGLRRHATLVSRLHALGEFVELSPNAAAERQRAVAEIEKAHHEEERAAEQEADCVARLGGLVAPEALLDVDDAIVSDLRDRRGRYNSAQLDRPKLEAKAMAIEASVEKNLETISAHVKVSELHVSVAGAARVRSLAARRQRLDQKLDGLRRTFDEVQSRRAHSVGRLAAMAVVERRDAVAAMLTSADGASAPTPESVERFALDFGALEAERMRRATEEERRSAQQRDVEHRLDALRRVGDIPTEAELVKARIARDGLFDVVRERSLGAGGFDGAAAREYQDSVGAADTVADRLRREADRVASLSALTAEHAAVVAEKGAANEAEERLGAREAALAASWLELWRLVAIVPRSPVEMRPWARDAQALLAVGPEVARVEREMARATEELVEFRNAWRDAVEALGLGADATEDEAFAVLDALTQQVRQIEEADGLRRRVDGIARDSTRFAADVAECCRRSLPEATELEPAEAAERFVRAVEQARANRAERARLDKELVRIRRTRTEQSLRRRDAEARLSSLVSAARVNDAAELEDAERRSAEGHALREQIQAVEAELQSVSDGMSFAVLEAGAGTQDLDRTRARLSDIDTELEELTDRLEQAVQTISQLERGVHSLAHTDTSEAAALLEDKVSVLKRHANRYVRVRLAAVLLKREIERYRQENQGPIVSRAGELFPRLTIGRYSGLRVGFGEDGESVLLAVRGDGTSVAVDALSDGTRDQLYLALRLASLERYAHGNEPMPLVLDDVLVHFDDDRARAALSVLGDVARTTQVLFFTHHARLVDLAKSALDPDRLAEHRMPDPG